jgi:hypothetical protein
MLFGRRAGEAVKRLGERWGKRATEMARKTVPGTEGMHILPKSPIRKKLPILGETTIIPSRRQAAEGVGHVIRNPDDAAVVAAIPGGTFLLPLKRSMGL